MGGEARALAGGAGLAAGKFTARAWNWRRIHIRVFLEVIVVKEVFRSVVERTEVE